jgi:hypothetical protein
MEVIIMKKLSSESMRTVIGGGWRCACGKSGISKESAAKHEAIKTLYGRPYVHHAYWN